MASLRRAADEGRRAALAKFALDQPSLSSVGIKSPAKAPGLPTPAAPAALPAPGGGGGGGGTGSLGISAAKSAADVGMGFSSARHDGPGAVPGEPADEGRRQRSVVDRAFQRNEDDFATSSMPLPGGTVSP